MIVAEAPSALGSTPVKLFTAMFCSPFHVVFRFGLATTSVRFKGDRSRCSPAPWLWELKAPQLSTCPDLLQDKPSERDYCRRGREELPRPEDKESLVTT